MRIISNPCDCFLVAAMYISKQRVVGVDSDCANPIRDRALIHNLEMFTRHHSQTPNLTRIQRFPTLYINTSIRQGPAIFSGACAGDIECPHVIRYGLLVYSLQLALFVLESRSSRNTSLRTMANSLYGSIIGWPLGIEYWRGC